MERKGCQDGSIHDVLFESSSESVGCLGFGLACAQRAENDPGTEIYPAQLNDFRCKDRCGGI